MEHPDDAPHRNLRVVTEENVIGAHYRRLEDDSTVGSDFFFSMLGKYVKIDGEPWAITRCESEANFVPTLGHHSPGTLSHITQIITLKYAGRSMDLVHKGQNWYVAGYEDNLRR